MLDAGPGGPEPSGNMYFKWYINECEVQNVAPARIFLLSLTSCMSIRDVQAVSLCRCIVPKPWVLTALFYVRAAAKRFVSRNNSVVVWDIEISINL